MREEQQIISQAKSGDLQAFQLLVENHSHKMYSLAYRILGDREHAEDCVQEVFIKVHSKLGSFQENSKFSTWVYSITTNTAIDLRRKYAKQQQHDSEDFESMPANDSISTEKAAMIDSMNRVTQRALMQLSEDVRVAFLLKHFEERSIEEISQILEINPNTVKNRIFRAVSRLREILQPKVGDYETVD